MTNNAALNGDMSAGPSGAVVDLDEARERRSPGPDTDPDTGADTGPDAAPDPGADADTDSGVRPSGSHFEVALDEEPSESVPVLDRELPAVQVQSDTRRPIVPSEWAGWVNIKSSVRYHAGLTAYRAGFHAVRSPVYAAVAVFWAVVGVFRVLNRQRRWWWLTEQWGLRQQAADANDAMAWLRLHHEVKATRATRGFVLGCEAVAVGVGGPVAWSLAPWWVRLFAVVGAVSGLARLGRPADRRILARAMTAARFRRLNPDIVLRAYYSAGLGRPDKPGQEVTFGSPMARDGEGSRVLVDLPYGKGFDDVVKARGGIASGLDVSINQVFLTPERSSHRRHVLWVADKDALAIPAGRTPLLDCRPRDIWTPAPFGLDERGNVVQVALMWLSVLIGAQPRKGKTFAARALALFCALDPWTKVFLVDGKNSPDWRKFSLVAEDMVFGTHPNRDGDPVERLLELLRRVKAHIQAVNEILSGLPVDQCPEGKLTRELARDRRFPELRVWVLVMEEFQVYYELDDKDASTEVAELLSFIMAVGPSSGVVLLSSSQKPSGVGAGQNVARLFNRYRDNHTARFALKCGNRVVSEAILGGDAYAEGFDASALPSGPEYRGVGYLYGITDATPTVRTYLADHGDAEKILHAARKYRQAAGTLSGLAAGEQVTREVRDVLADTRAVLHAGETGASWDLLAGRLAEQVPEHYADITGAALSAQLRDLGVRSVNVKKDGRVLKGAHTADIDAAITRRATD